MLRSWIISTPWSPVVSVPSLAGMCSSLDIEPLYLFFSHKTPLSRYRRGKPESNDIDIVFTHPNTKSAKNLCGRLVERLRSEGLVTHIMCESRLTWSSLRPSRRIVNHDARRPLRIPRIRCATHCSMGLAREGAHGVPITLRWPPPR